MFQKSGKITLACYSIYIEPRKNFPRRLSLCSTLPTGNRASPLKKFTGIFIPSSKKFFWEVITIPIRIISPGSQKRPLSWGLQGEHNATQLQLDVRQFLAAWPDGTPALMVTRQDGHPYLLDKSQWVLDIPTTNIVATLSNRETELLGRIELVISWSRADGSIAKSQSYLGFISGNPTSSSLPLTPSVIEALDDLKAAGERAEEAAKRAEAAAASVDAKVSDEDGLVYTKVLTALELPSVGKVNRLYVETSTSKLWIWDETSLKYVCVGTGTASSSIDPDVICGGNAFST